MRSVTQILDTTLELATDARRYWLGEVDNPPRSGLNKAEQARIVEELKTAERLYIQAAERVERANAVLVSAAVRWMRVEESGADPHHVPEPGEVN